MANSGMIAGLYTMLVATRDSNGYPVGTNTTPDTKTTNTVYSPLRVRFPVTVGGPQPTLEVATRRGGMAVRGKRYLGVSDYGTFDITLDGYDQDFHALVSGTAVDTTTVANWVTTAYNSNLATPPQLCALFTMGFTTDGGLTRFLNVFYNNVTIAPKVPTSSQDGGANPNPLAYTVTPDVSSRRMDGRLYSVLTNQTVRDNTDMMWMVESTNEFMFSTYIGNGTITNFTLPYKPTSSLATGADTNSITLNGTTQAAATVATATGVVTFSAAPANNAVVVFVGPTNFL